MDGGLADKCPRLGAGRRRASQLPFLEPRALGSQVGVVYQVDGEKLLWVLAPAKF